MTRYFAFLAQACQRLWPVAVNGVYRLFTYVDLTIKPGTPTAMTLAVVVFLTAWTIHYWKVTLSQELHTVTLPSRHVLVGYS